MTLREQINTLGENGTPFLFCIDYKAKNGFAYPLDKIPHEISYSFDKNIQHTIYKVPAITDKNPITKEIYKQKIEAVKNRIKNGDIYMANLTAITDIELNCELEEIFSASKAPYRLLVKDKFVVSSPEAFINIKNGKIYKNSKHPKINPSAHLLLVASEKRCHRVPLAVKIIKVGNLVFK